MPLPGPLRRCWDNETVLALLLFVVVCERVERRWRG